MLPFKKAASGSPSIPFGLINNEQQDLEEEKKGARDDVDPFEKFNGHRISPVLKTSPPRIAIGQKSDSGSEFTVFKVKEEEADQFTNQRRSRTNTQTAAASRKSGNFFLP